MSSSSPDDSTNLRRSLRTRVKRKIFEEENSNYPVSLDEKAIEELYCQANTKLSKFNPSALETIFESPKRKNLSTNFMSVIKLKRQCSFTPFYNPSKVKLTLRKKKSLTLKRNGVKVPTGFNVTVEQVESVLQSLYDSENKLDNSLHYMDHKNDVHPISISTDTGLKSKVSEERAIANQSFNIFSPKLDINPPKNLNEFPSSIFDKSLNFDSKLDLDYIPHQYSVSIDKKQRNKRRSRKFEPFLPNDIFGDPPLLQQSALNEISKENFYIPQPQDIADDNIGIKNCDQNETRTRMNFNASLESTSVSMSGNRIDNYKDLSETGSKFISSPKRGKVKKQKQRRNSGLRKPLYKSIPNYSPDLDTSGNSPLKNSSEILHENSLSPSSLIEKLNLNSTIVESKSVKHGHRKSARLSVGKSAAILGSLWMDKQNVNSPLNDILSTQNDNSILREPFSETDEQNFEQPSISMKGVLGSLVQEGKESENVHSNITAKRNLNHKENGCNGTDSHIEKDFTSYNSPVLSGIFDGKARVNQDRKIVYKKGSKIKLSHFNFDL